MRVMAGDHKRNRRVKAVLVGLQRVKEKGKERVGERESCSGSTSTGEKLRCHVSGMLWGQ